MNVAETIKKLGGDGSTLSELHGAVLRAEYPNISPYERGKLLSAEGDLTEAALLRRAERFVNAGTPRPTPEPQATPEDSGDADSESA